ncbi:POK6 protein, partial [Pardalotus punctatus]|nr:POK6 protein [Pardalotus punctatus]
HHHFLAAFATLGMPQHIKTDNGPAYISHSLSTFFALWGVQHTTWIPHSPTGQAVIEWARST